MLWPNLTCKWLLDFSHAIEADVLEIAEVCARPKVYRLPAKGWIAQSAEIVGFD